MKNLYFVISHTHWDREWYRPFEEFRIQLTRLINNLFEILEENPDYIFHLDAQTVVLEDYLEIYPENADKLKKWISSGNILVGPWYLQNDFYLTSGEATIRNLLIGTEIAERFGKCLNVGYAADQFGNISQLPQILGQFGIDNFIFGRGFKPQLTGKAPSEFRWVGADGSELLAIHMKDWYNNLQRLPDDAQKAFTLVEEVGKNFEGVAVTPYILCMNGVDHLEAQEDLLNVLEKVNGKYGEKRVFQTSMADYVDRVKTYIAENGISLYEHRGEMRQGGDNNVLQGTLSSRHYLKVLNVAAQTMLENRLEPLYSMLELKGMKGSYPANFMKYLWKELLKNHPHDSICGCSRDEIHKHMEDRYLRIKEVGDRLLREGLELAAYHNGTACGNINDYSLVLVNTSSFELGGTVEARLVFPEKDGVRNFRITDKDGNNVPFAVRSYEKITQDVFSPINLPGHFPADCYNIYFFSDGAEPMSIKGYKITKCGGEQPRQMCVTENDEKSIENEFFILTADNNGKISFKDKNSGRTAENLMEIEDSGDIGDAYRYAPCGEARFFGSVPARVTVTEKNRFRSMLEVEKVISVPERYDFENRKRSDKNTEITVKLKFTLNAGEKMLRADYTVANTAEDHRLRLHIASDISANSFFADIPFDIIERRDGEIEPDTVSNTHPDTSFAYIENGKERFAVFTAGAHECEKTNGNTLAFTLVRSTGVIDRSGGEQWKCPENQCKRTVSGSLGISFMNCGESCYKYAAMLKIPLIAHYMPCDQKKFTGGRTTVQGTNLLELFFRKDPYADVLIDEKPVFALSNKKLVISAFKQAESGNGYVLRIFNPERTAQKTAVRFDGALALTTAAEQTYEEFKSGGTEFELAPKEFKTIIMRKEESKQ